MERYNLTPHEICVYNEQGLVVKFPSDGALRLVSEPQNTPILDPNVLASGLPMIRGQVFTGVDPSSPGYAKFAAPSEKHVDIIVSLPMAQWMTAHKDAWECNALSMSILCPATSPSYAVRDDKGQLIGCKALEWHCTKHKGCGEGGCGEQ